MYICIYSIISIHFDIGFVPFHFSDSNSFHVISHQVCDWYVYIPFAGPELRELNSLKGPDPCVVDGYLRENLLALLPSNNDNDGMEPSKSSIVASHVSGGSRGSGASKGSQRLVLESDSMTEPVPRTLTNDVDMERPLLDAPDRQATPDDGTEHDMTYMTATPLASDEIAAITPEDDDMNSNQMIQSQPKPPRKRESQSDRMVDISPFSLLTLYYYHHIYPVPHKPEFVAPVLVVEDAVVEPVEESMSRSRSRSRSKSKSKSKSQKSHKSQRSQRSEREESKSRSAMLVPVSAAAAKEDTVTEEEKMEEERDASRATANTITPFPGSPTLPSDDEDVIDPEEEEEEEEEFDVTLGGCLNWHALADFTAMLPPRVKDKLWKGVFKTDADWAVEEKLQIARLLRPMALLYLKQVGIALSI